MKKRMIAMLVCILLVLALVPGVASAKGNGPDRGDCGYGVVVQHGRGHLTKEQKTLERMVAQANKRIDQMVKKAQKTPQNDVAQLLVQVDAIVAQVFAYAESIGAELTCEYVGYYIDGQYVLIDPIRIIRL